MVTFAGTAGNDTYNGTSSADTINGLAGNDTLNGLGGNDTINGGDDNDNINPGLGVDAVEGGNGDDLLIIDYSSNTYTGTSPSAGINSSIYRNGLGFDGNYYAYRDNTAYDQANFTNIERFQITGTSKNDNITTGSGNDTVSGGAGDDIIDVGGGSNTADGGAGIDTLNLDLSAATSNITINNPNLNINLASFVTASNFENFNITTGSGNDSFTQSGLVSGVAYRSSENLTLGTGNDTFNGGLGIDWVTGGDGDDLLILDYSNGDIGNELQFDAYNYNYVEGAIGSGYRYTADNSSELDRIDFYRINRFQITGTSKDDRISMGEADGYVSGNDTINGGAGNDEINSAGGNDSINGGTGDEHISSGAGDDNIDGGAGNDYIRSGGGNDSIIGGTGNDTIYVDSGNDTADGGADTDTLYLDLSASTSNITINNPNVNFNLAGIISASNFENFTIETGSGNDSFTQSALVNGVAYRSNIEYLILGTGNDTFNGGLGIDWVTAGDGDDLLILDYSNGDTGNQLQFNAYNYYAEGSYGQGFRNTADNSSQLDGTTFSGINRFQITGTSKDDSINIYDYYGYEGASDTINGGAGNDNISSGDGDDSINGGTGNDTAAGGAGNDIYNVDDTTDIVSETNLANTDAGGIDTIFATVSYTLPNFVEKLTLKGVINLNGTGNSLNNTITGNSGDNLLTGNDGNDILNGGKGSDTMNGGAGNDTYYVDRLTDVIIDSAGQDTVRSTISYTLASNLEILILTGSANLNGTGNTARNKITGNSGANTLIGDAGNDTLTGGAGNDSFRFNNQTEGIDTITDFNVANDTIVVAKSGFSNDLTANAVITTAQFILGASATTSAHRFGYNSTNGNLWFDSDGNGATASIQFATLSTGLALTNADIFVV